jgi:hypothetical protein
MRISGSFPLVARTATQSASSKGSETISKRSPYIFMWTEVVKPRSLILTQLSESICTVFNRSFLYRLAAVTGGVRALFADRFLDTADHFLNFAGFLLRVSGDFEIGVVRRLPDLLFDLPFHFVKLALGPVLRTWFHHFFPFHQFNGYATSFLSIATGTCTNSSNKER